MTELEPARTDSNEPAVPGAEANQPPTVPSGPPLFADGRERPRFLLEFPDDPELTRLAAAFEAGDYRAVRIGAGRLAETTEDPLVREAARELRRRIDPDPLMKYLLAVALTLFVFVVWYTYQSQPH